MMGDVFLFGRHQPQCGAAEAIQMWRIPAGNTRHQAEGKAAQAQTVFILNVFRCMDDPHVSTVCPLITVSSHPHVSLSITQSACEHLGPSSIKLPSPISYYQLARRLSVLIMPAMNFVTFNQDHSHLGVGTRNASFHQASTR